ncbi:T9SS type A sorting domain-containing protein [Marivirga tractuosa]|uniref:T9SS type A sorting domain-containing protein n=1 Tax=Marivirga tractuosa TaxID=1006 RepID=UPI0035CFCBBB
MQQKNLLILFITILCINIGYSQSINSAGNSNQLINHQITWSVGDVFASANVNIANGGLAEVISIIEQEENITANQSYNNFQLSIYPNPANDHVNISLSDNINDAEIQLINSSGAVLKTTNKNQLNSNTQIPIGDLENGIYFITISNKNYNTKTFKILKK